MKIRMPSQRAMRNTAANAAIIVCAVIFGFGVFSKVGHAPEGAVIEPAPFNPVLFLSLFAVPILLSLAVALTLYATQMYRASNGTRNRGWEEQL